MFNKIKRLLKPLETQPSGLIVIETTTICNLQCLHCPCPEKTGGIMEWVIFTRIIDKTCSFAKEYRLSNWGEPMLHPRLYNMIAYIKHKDRNIRVSMFSNGNILNKGRIAAVCESGLNEITVGLDGYNQDTYEQHRPGGNFKVVNDFIRLCGDERRLCNLDLTIKASVKETTSLNQNIKIIKDIAKDLGCDEVVRVHYDGESRRNGNYCDELFETIFFDVKGRLHPCSHYVVKEHLENHHTKDSIVNHNDVKKWWQDSFFYLRRQCRENEHMQLCRGCHKNG